jgi:hypothetical protein
MTSREQNLNQLSLICGISGLTDSPSSASRCLGAFNSSIQAAGLDWACRVS